MDRPDTESEYEEEEEEEQQNDFNMIFGGHTHADPERFINKLKTIENHRSLFHTSTTWIDTLSPIENIDTFRRIMKVVFDRELVLVGKYLYHKNPALKRVPVDTIDPQNKRMAFLFACFNGQLDTMLRVQGDIRDIDIFLRGFLLAVENGEFQIMNEFSEPSRRIYVQSPLAPMAIVNALAKGDMAMLEYFKNYDVIFRSTMLQSQAIWACINADDVKGLILLESSYGVRADLILTELVSTSGTLEMFEVLVDFNFLNPSNIANIVNEAIDYSREDILMVILESQQETPLSNEVLTPIVDFAAKYGNATITRHVLQQANPNHFQDLAERALSSSCFYNRENVLNTIVRDARVNMDTHIALRSYDRCTPPMQRTLLEYSLDVFNMVSTIDETKQMLLKERAGYVKGIKLQINDRNNATRRDTPLDRINMMIRGAPLDVALSIFFMALGDKVVTKDPRVSVERKERMFRDALSI